MTNFNAAAAADAYAQLHAEHKSLTKRLDEQKQEIIDHGVGEYVGEYYTVTYKKSEPVRTFDKKLASSLLSKYGLTAEQIENVFGCTKIGECRNNLTITASALSLAAE